MVLISAKPESVAKPKLSAPASEASTASQPKHASKPLAPEHGPAAGATLAPALPSALPNADSEASRPAPAIRQASPFYRPELDALRLVAFLMVWTAHSLPTPAEAALHRLTPASAWWLAAVKDAGNFGVCIFFFLSAYLITELLRRERFLTGSVHLRAFYLRRILRIWPLYLGVLAAYALLGLRFHGFRIEPGRLLASLLLAGNWYIAWHPAILTPMRALWSLSVEEQFYLGWPLLARWARPVVVAGVSFGLVVLGNAMLFRLARSHAPALHITAWVNSLVQFQYFALGALAAIALRGRALTLSLLQRGALASIAASAMLLASGVCGIKRDLVSHSGASLAAGYLLVLLACGLLFAAVLGLPDRLIPRWTITLGRVSFGLYVFHETGFFLADAFERHLLAHAPGLSAQQHAHWVFNLAANKALSLSFTVVLALLSYRFWERPFLRLKERFTFARSREA